MKRFLLLSTIFMLAVSADKCGTKKGEPIPYKGKLETKGLCMNYTIRLLEGSIDTSLISASWTDEVKGKTFTSVFGLGSPCTFPATINEGDEFYFMIDTATVQNCAVCMAYYPTPPKKLAIKVISK
ncbi:MAG: hypothetical protein JNK14_19010 [Chitinophagaceae bacterium]|nr:hypothetical protein [Chitinophagaceae bacterium]